MANTVTPGPDAPLDAVSTGTEVPHDAGQAKAFPPLDPAVFAPQLVWLAITFGALYVILSRVALPRVSEVIEERRDRIQRDFDAAERLKNETDKALSGYEKALSDARSNASGIANKEREILDADVAKEQAKVEDQISTKLAEAEARISETKTKALQGVNTIAADTAIAIVAKLVGDTVSADEAKSALPAAGSQD